MTSAKKTTIIKESQYELPFDIWNSDTVCVLFEFYLYNMASAKNSPLSYDLQSKLSDMQKQELLQKILDVAGCTAGDFVYGQFLNNRLKEIERHKLDDDSFTCDRVKGFMHSQNNDFSFDILMKHIRNSFAHGRIARSLDHRYIILEDKKNQLTARIVLNNDTLELWRDVIVDYQKKHLKV